MLQYMEPVVPPLSQPENTFYIPVPSPVYLVCLVLRPYCCCFLEQTDFEHPSLGVAGELEGPVGVVEVVGVDAGLYSWVGLNGRRVWLLSIISHHIRINCLTERFRHFISVLVKNCVPVWKSITDNFAIDYKFSRVFY